MDKKYFVLLAAMSVVPAGCSMGPEYARPEAPIPTTFPSGPAYKEATAEAGAPAAMEVPWQEFFTDERLQKVIAIALENNRDLRSAALNVERASALYGVQRSELLPKVYATANAAKHRVPGDLSATGKRTTLEQYDVNLGTVAWELDFFGRIRSLEKQALEEYLATEQAQRSAQVLLVSGVANAYLTLAADRQSLKLAKTTLETQQGAYDLVKRRFERGVAPELDVFRAQTQVDTARGDVARFTQLVAQDENALNLLVAATVPADLLPTDLEQIRPPKEISAGTSSEVLLYRPDILQAENRLRAANANIGAARAAFFPRITLTGAVGTASSDLDGLFKSGSGTWSFGPQVALPIFDPQIWSAAKVSEADKKIAIAQYEKAIQTGFREVADALAVNGTVNEQVAAQESLVRAVSETYRLSNSLYTKGLQDYLSVLDAQRSLYAAQQQLVSLQLAKVANQVTLYAVLGGGWQNPGDVSEGQAAAK
ncbi:MAG TPA: efflux transporter outer membrane subunit [Tepidisphaeraceae bacterium]|nr:efflux transporter outer membrane subunit [Tepidisphaeraceae bacterium]